MEDTTKLSVNAELGTCQNEFDATPLSVVFYRIIKYIPDMVGFPDSPTEPALSNVTVIKLNDCTDRNEHLVNKPNDREVKDHAVTIERDNMSNGKDNYALDFDSMEKAIDNKLNTSTDIKAEPDIVKKVAGKNLYTYRDTYSIDIKKMQKENQ